MVAKFCRYFSHKGKLGAVIFSWVIVLLLFTQIDISFKYTHPEGFTPADSNISILSDSDFPRIKPQVCRRSIMLSDNKTQNDVMICAKPEAVDEVISGAIITSGAWEPDQVEIVLHWLQIYRGEATFLDLGANIGMFSVAASVFNHSVVSVDPIKTNLAYIHASVLVSGGTGSVTYVHNCISNESTVLYPWNRYAFNEGAMTLLSEQEKQNKKPEEIGAAIVSVTLEDILQIIPTHIVILKIDIEGYECRALRNFLTSSTKPRYIPYILIEWEIIRMHRDGVCLDLVEFTQSFVNSGYSPYSEKMVLLDPKVTLPINVIWIHKDARRL